MEEGQLEGRAPVRQYFVRRKERQESNDGRNTGLETPLTSRFSKGTHVKTPEGGSGFVSSETFGWVGRSLASRKSSVFLKFGMAVGGDRHSLHHPARKRKTRQEYGRRRKVPLPMDEREEFRQKLELQDLKKYFAKVDEFQLVEELPGFSWKRLRSNSGKPVLTPTPSINEIPPSGQFEEREFSLDDAHASGQGKSESRKTTKPQSIAGRDHPHENSVSLRRSKSGEEISEMDVVADSVDGDGGGFEDMLVESVRERLRVTDGAGGSSRLESSNPGGARDLSLIDENRWRASGEGAGPSAARDLRTSIFEYREDGANRMESLVDVGSKKSTLVGSVGGEKLVNRADSSLVPEEANLGGELGDARVSRKFTASPAPRKSMLEIVVEEKHLLPMDHLLNTCNQKVDEKKLPSMRAVLEEFVDLKQIEKIGEGTYGEAFKYRDLVVKIVPIEGEEQVNGCAQKKADEVLGEVVISSMLADLRRQEFGDCQNRTNGLAFTHAVRICQGKYCPELLAEWKRWNDYFNSENDPVDSFSEEQLFIVFLIENAGQQLENFELRNFSEAKSMLLQTVLTCAVGEEALQFEHRDLHCGNILLKRTTESTTSVVLREQTIQVENQGIEVVLIDFTLSRVGLENGEVAFCDLAMDPGLFQGPKRDCQADTYRRMRKAVKDQWADFCPKTNALWIHYLTDVLLTLKKIPMTDSDKRDLRAFRKRALQAKSCCDLVFDSLFSALWHVEPT
ncbi:hypothetical protein BSKO_01626 [Bryopsis sp. KO-2023]|nr:hypothetical protein BSKO_01626 [Bryopsis sp. KO-2023]